MPILPEKTQQESEPSTTEAEKALIGAGYYRLSKTDKKVITGKAEALKFAEETAEEQEKKQD
jgi:hypothetical protein